MVKNCVKRVYHGLSVSGRLLITYLLVSIVPILCLTVYAFSQYNSGLKSETIRSLELSTYDVIRQLEEKLESYHSDMSRIIYDVKINEIFTTDDKETRQKLISQYLLPNISLVKGLDIALKDIYIYADGTYDCWYIKDIDTVRSLSAYDFTIDSGSSITVDSSQIFYARPFRLISDRAKELMITMSIDKDLFFYGLNTNKNDIGIIIYDNLGRCINYKDIDEDYELRKNPLPKVETEKNNIGKVNGKSCYYYESVSDKSGWKIVCYKQKGTEMILDNLVFILVMTCVVINLVVILSILLSKVIVKPILQLNRKMKQVEGGNYSVQLDVSGSDEISQLAENFNQMVRRIQKLVDIELKQEITIRDNQLESLYAKISPHFLYNTLYTINMKAIMQDSPEISMLVTSLSSFYRTALNRGKLTISVAGEIENLKAYINIQSVMHGDSFEVQYRVDEDILDCSIANFVLQPLVENAIEHGTDMIDEKGIIVITGKRYSDNIILTVEDNGPGFDTTKKAKSKKSGGYGVHNVDERIKLLFGDGYGLEFTRSSLGGACVKMKIPRIIYNEDGT